MGSQAARIERIARNRFKITLGHAPEHRDWSNMLQFHTKQNAKGASLRLDMEYYEGIKIASS